MVTPLRAALVTPLSGPLAGYGTAGAVALRLWAEWAGADLVVHDAHPDAVAALRSAEVRRPDLVFGPYGSGPASDVVAAATRLIWNHGGARLPASPRVVSVLAPARTYWDGAVRVAADAGIRRVEVRHGPTGFGRAVGEGAAAAARKRGLAVTVVTLPGPDPEGPADETMLLVAGRFAEERDAAVRLLHRPWRAAGFVGAGVEEILAGLGSDREGLLGPAQWLASAAPDADEGPAAPDFVAAYRRVAGSDPPYPAAQAFAAGVVAARCVRDAGTVDDAGVRAAAVALTCTTLFAPFRLDPVSGEQRGHRVLTVQWQDGGRRVVWPPELARSGFRPRRRPLSPPDART